MGMRCVARMHGGGARRRTGALVRVGWALSLAALLASQAARGDVILIVDTAADVIANDGLCSLREAITAANDDANSFGCLGNGGGFDRIEFALGSGTPLIQLASPLPAITEPVAIDGGPGRVEIRGMGSGSGLSLVGPATADSTIRNLVLNGFENGIFIAGTSNVTITGCHVGTNATGSAASANTTGIYAFSASARIGGTAGWTPAGSCTGHCNLISGNTVRGVYLTSGSSALIQGNLIGTDASGSMAIGNGIGVFVDESIATVGGSTFGAGNLVSGNGDGILIKRSTGLETGSFVQGNSIGTDASGSAAIANLTGIRVDLGNQVHPVTIGGATALAGNLISGNAGAGIHLERADLVTIHGNRIGTRADGTSPLPNGGFGVELASSTHANVIGGIGPGEGNVIAFNAIGVTIGVLDYANVVRGNAIHGHVGRGIALADDQFSTATTPTITGVAPVSGTACPGCTVDVYSDLEDEGGTFEGSTTADGLGSWTFDGAVDGPNVTATATSAAGSTSEFSAAVPEPGMGLLLGTGVAWLAAAAPFWRAGSAMVRIRSSGKGFPPMGP